MKSSNQLFYLIIVLLVIIILGGCSTSSLVNEGSTQQTEKEVQASQVVNDLEEGLAAQDDNQLENVLGSEVKVTVGGTTTTYTKDQFISQYKTDEELQQLFQINESTVEEKEDKVIIRGEAGLNSKIISDISILNESSQQSNLIKFLIESTILKEKELSENLNFQNISAVGTSSGNYYSFDYPNNWRELKLDQMIEDQVNDLNFQYSRLDLITLIKESNLPLVGVIGDIKIQDSSSIRDFSNLPPSEIKLMEEQIRINLKQGANNVDVNVNQMTVDSYSAVDTRMEFDFSYQPQVVEIVVEAKGEEMVIKEMTIQGGSTKTARYKGSMIIANEQNRFVVMYYFGFKDAYDQSEIDSITNSYQIKN